MGGGNPFAQMMGGMMGGGGGPGAGPGGQAQVPAVPVPVDRDESNEELVREVRQMRDELRDQTRLHSSASPTRSRIDNAHCLVFDASSTDE